MDWFMWGAHIGVDTRVAWGYGYRQPHCCNTNKLTPNPAVSKVVARLSKASLTYVKY